MDDLNKIILEISSDEEVGWGDSGLTSAGDGDDGGRDDSDWISELLDEVKRKAGEADEVVVGEVIPCKKRKVEKPCADRVDDDDDDCVVLDGDPDKPVTIENGGGEESDDLMLVSEKGQVACRDYPHPRHLCVKFPFSSSPHERHCDQCHCYVCDSLAPCVLWGTGVSSIDHCHATEKDEFWKSQRKSSRNGGIALSIVPIAADTSVPVGPTTISQITPLLNIPSMRNHGQFGQSGEQFCPPATNAIPPIVSTHGRTQLSRCNIQNKVPHQSMPQQTQRHSISSAGPRSTSGYVQGKDPIPNRHLMTHQAHGYNASRNTNRVQILQNQTSAKRWDDSSHQVTPSSAIHQRSRVPRLQVSSRSGIPQRAKVYNVSTQPSMGHENARYVSSTCQVSPQILGNRVIANYVLPQAHLSPQSFPCSNLRNPLPTPYGTATPTFPVCGFGPIPFQSPAGVNVAKFTQIPEPCQQLGQSSVNSNSTLNAAPTVTSPPMILENLLENQMPNQPQIHALMEYPVSAEGNQAEMATRSSSADIGSVRHCLTSSSSARSSSADIGSVRHCLTSESNHRVPDSTQLQSAPREDNPTPNCNLQFLARALDSDYDDLLLAGEGIPNWALDLDCWDIPSPPRIDVLSPL